MHIILRDYQGLTVDVVHGALRRVQRVICVLPTGTGKRYLGVWWCQKALEKERKVLVVTDRRILVQQMKDECRGYGVDVGVIMGNEVRNDLAGVQIASIQTLKSRDWQDLPIANLILIDEAHKEAAGYSALFERYQQAKVIGLTATPVGAQGRSLLGTWQEIVEPVTNTQAIKAGWLLKCQVWSPSEPDIEGVQIGTKKVTVSNGEFNQTELAQAVEECTVFTDVFKWWEPFKDMQTICFAPKVKYAYGLAEQFKERGIAAEVIEAGTSTGDRKDIFEQFENREVRVLLSVDVLKEGFDAPIAQCGIDLQPNHQLRTYWQKIGRIKRPHEGQQHAIWLDFAGNYWRFPHPDEDPDWLSVTSEISTQDIIKAKREEEGADKQPWSCPHCSYSLAPWERLHGNTCPNCGKPIGKSIRRIRMRNGEMKSVSAEQKKKVKSSHEQSVWDRCRYKAFYCGKTLDFARFLYKQETGHYPPDGLKSCPSDACSGDWKRKVSDVYPWMGNRRKATQ